MQRPGLQPPVFATEYADVEALVRADPRWKKAMRDRGIDPDDVYLDSGWGVGDVTVPGVPAGTRLLRALSFFQGDLPNPYDRPIEGVVVTIDMNRLKVVEVIDSGIRPVNKTITGNAETTRTGLKPLRVNQPDGPSFTLNGNEVSWQGWRFRVGYSQREGLVLYQIGYEQDGAVRPIIHRIALDEIYVPYAIPDPNWSWRAALDIGEYNLGQLAKALKKNVDVPENAVFLDEVAPLDIESEGELSYDMPHAVAMYERDAGSLWDRTDPTTFEKDARFARELVLTAAYPNGNYTYTIEYVFRHGRRDRRARRLDRDDAQPRRPERSPRATSTGPRSRRTSRRRSTSTSSTSGSTSTSTGRTTGSSRRTRTASRARPGNAFVVDETEHRHGGLPRPERGDEPALGGREHDPGERARPPDRLRARSRRQQPRLLAAGLRAAPAGAVRAAPALGHALPRRRRAVRARRLPEPGPGRARGCRSTSPTTRASTGATSSSGTRRVHARDRRSRTTR